MKLYAKKSLGQNFLRSEKAISDIIGTTDTLDLSVPIIEIGGGEGVVTRRLLEKGFNVHVIEIDERAVEKMNSDLKEYIDSGKLQIHHGDVLETDFTEYLPRPLLAKEGSHAKYAVVGNIPYYITGLIFRHVFGQGTLPSTVTFMVQREVSERAIAKSGKESLMSLSLKFYGNLRQVCVVKAGSFVPAPKVDSAILHISEISEVTGLADLIKTIEFKLKEENFFKIIHAAFIHPRKYALSNIKKYLGEESDLYISAKNYLDEKVRAEDVPLETWKKIISTT
jgi:16S rRNA (adenine1518-N6/adenine1519-N6)-dimethyltransferase